MKRLDWNEKQKCIIFRYLFCKLKDILFKYQFEAKELEVCLTCGAFQVKGDAQQRIEEHLQGKMHIGYAQIRQYISDFASNCEKSKSSKIELERKRFFINYLFDDKYLQQQTCL